MGIETDEHDAIGEVMRVVRTGKVGRVMSVDDEWGKVFPHKGPMVVLDIDSARICYSLCELDTAEPFGTRTVDSIKEFH